MLDKHKSPLSILEEIKNPFKEIESYKPISPSSLLDE